MGVRSKTGRGCRRIVTKLRTKSRHHKTGFRHSFKKVFDPTSTNNPGLLPESLPRSRSNPRRSHSVLQKLRPHRKSHKNFALVDSHKKPSNVQILRKHLDLHTNTKEDSVRYTPSSAYHAVNHNLLKTDLERSEQIRTNSLRGAARLEQFSGGVSSNRVVPDYTSRDIYGKWGDHIL